MRSFLLSIKRFNCFTFRLQRNSRRDQAEVKAPGSAAKGILIGGAVSMLLFGAISMSEAFNLPDSGQTKCYQGVSPYAVITCPSSGNSLAQDGSYSINPPSYTDNNDGTVTDNNTGLIWQKQDDGTARAWFDASAYCASLGTGWRLPSKMELMSIVDYSIPYPGPTINPLFTNSKKSGYWTSTTGAGSTDYPRFVHFSYGYVSYYPSTTTFYARCVMGGQ